MTLSSLAVRVSAFASAVACVLATVSAVHAQDWLIVGGQSIRASGPSTGEPTGPAPVDVAGPGVLLAGGGRYAVRTTGNANNLSAMAYDRRTGRLASVDDGQVVNVDPVRPRAFIKHACHPTTGECSLSRWDLLSGALTRLATVWGGQSTTVTRYAVDADVLFIDQSRTSSSPFDPPPAELRIGAVQATTGALVGAPVVRPQPGLRWEVLPDGRRLFLQLPWVFGVSVIDTSSGLAVATLPAGDPLSWNDALDALLVSGGRTIAAYDRALQVVGTAPAGPGGQCPPQVEVSPHTGRIFMLSGGHYSFTDYPHELRTFDPATGESRLVDLTRTAGLPAAYCQPMLLKTAPGPPRRLSARVVGHDVSMAWENVGAASQFILEVGFAAGRTDVSIYLGSDSHATFAGVPSGRYYVRMRGGNEFGGGRPSPEVRLVVP